MRDPWRHQHGFLSRARTGRFQAFCLGATPAFILCLGCLAPIAVLSYYIYSLPGAHWTHMNADLAIHPLMTYHLTRWDFYYWGQDRSGSLIPFLAAMLVKGVGLDAVDAVTWVLYALVLAGWAGFAILLHHPWLACVLGVFLLTPPFLFAPLILAGHPYPGQVFAFGLMAAALTRWPAAWTAPTLVALAGLSVWASDFSIIILGVVVVTAVLMNCDLSPFRQPSSWLAGAGALLFLGIAKLSAQVPLHRLGSRPSATGLRLFAFSSFDGFLSTLTQYGHHLAGLFASPPYALLLLSGGIAAARLAVLPRSFSTRCSLAGSLTAIALSLAAAGSQWVAENNASPYYLSISFLFFVLSLLLAVSGEVKRGWKAVQHFLLMAAVALHVASLIPHAQGFPSTRDILRPLLTSGCSAFIGDYHTAYLVAGMFPDRFLATPYEGGGVRSWRMRDLVLAQPDICLIQERWLEEFPDEIRQFGRVLKKSGVPQQYGIMTICRYTQVPPS